jgi:succinate dehydrogenase/fumarate reductase flavoprotein subunit
MSLPRAVDVLVLGFGAAGASAAIAAHDAGARVAVVEKTAAGGGNCRHSGGFLFDVEGPAAVDHLDALCFGRTDRAILETFAEGLHDVGDWLRSLGGELRVCDPEAFGGMLPSWPGFPGAGHVTYSQFAGDGMHTGEELWACLRQAVAARGIPMQTGTAAVDIIRRGAGNDEGPAIGVTLARGTIEHTVRAERGIVLACGGIEYDPELRDTYLPLPMVPVGHPGNTGDALRLALGAGASLWHMSSFFGWFCFQEPSFGAAFALDVHAPSFIYLDGDGRRFADETGWEVHDKVRAATAYLPRRPNRPRLPGWLVFDEAARLAGPLNGVVGTPNDYAWSPRNEAELKRGWIKRGANAPELAAVTGLDPETLSVTLDRYGAFTAAGRDDDFGRAPVTLAPLEPPLYAIRLSAGLATASGGPRRDARARVLAPGGEPIEGLYAAGAAGSIWGHLTEHGGGLTDAIVFGRIAGAEAAAHARTHA